MIVLGTTYPPQVSAEIFLQDVFYMISAVAVLIAILGLGFIDSGLARRKNVLDSWIQKLVAAMVGAFAFIWVGYAVWNWQYNTAFGVPNALQTALQTWWLGGQALTNFAQFLDPSTNPEADVFQVFMVFFITFAMLIGAFIQSSGLERLKPAALYVMVAFAVFVPWTIVTYLMWGSVSPLTNAGVHDYVGIFNGYLFVGTWSIVLNKFLGPRLGSFKSHPRTDGPVPHDWGQVVAGVIMLMFAIPFIVMGSGFIVAGTGYFGISMTTSGFGIALINVFAAFIGGGLAGAVLAWWQKNPLWTLFGPIAGYISGAALFDITVPWIMLIVAMLGPVAAFITYRVLRAMRIDDSKVGPLTFGPAVYGAIIAGFIGWHVKTGGFFGLTGTYGFQHAEITPWWQIVGVVVTILISGVSAALICFILKSTIGLRVSEEQELTGLDQTNWAQSAYSESH